MDVWLASNSQRRFALLVHLFPNLHHEGLAGVDETPPSGTVEHQVLTICRRKAGALPETNHELVIVADTMLSDPDDHSLSMGKPRDRTHAAIMLHRLSGRLHQVWSATGVRWNGTWHFWCEASLVSIPELSDEQLDELLSSDSWEGKAGGTTSTVPWVSMRAWWKEQKAPSWDLQAKQWPFLRPLHQLADAHNNGVKPNSCFCMSTTTFCPGIMSNLSSASSEKTLTRAWSAMCLISLRQAIW